MPLLRIVRLEFPQERIADFQQVFLSSRSFIESMPGCEGVELRQELDKPGVFFTVSHWHTVDNLNYYRDSDKFVETWKTIKPWFIAKPQAWTLEKIF